MTAAGEYPNLYNLDIESSSGNYEIYFEPFDNQINARNFCLVDSFFIDSLIFESKNIIWVDATEDSKTLTSAERIVIELSRMGMTKGDHLLVIGGGCLQDIGTLVASLYMRGVKWTYVPTTLAAMGDSCIGGKSSINAGSVKNLVGNFYPPQKVIIDQSFCKTLPPLELIAGISEIIKICYAHSKENFMQSLEHVTDEDFRNRSENLNSLIHLSLKSKQYFIEVDEFDTGIRKLLNFGHSFGHALEASSGYQIPHGVAVMIGMIAAIKHNDATQTKEAKTLQRICLEFLKTVSKDIEGPLAEIDLQVFGEFLKRDKKNTSENLVLILPKSDGLSIVEKSFNEGAVQLAVEAMETARIEVLNEIR
ncbi:MAG: 3-dehydroquinate synthase family protein [Actinomycetes bacterium]